MTMATKTIETTKIRLWDVYFGKNMSNQTIEGPNIETVIAKAQQKLQEGLRNYKKDGWDSVGEYMANWGITKIELVAEED